MTSPCPYLNLWTFFIFSLPCTIGEGSDIVALVGTWPTVRANSPKKDSLPFIICMSLSKTHLQLLLKLYVNCILLDNLFTGFRFCCYYLFMTLLLLSSEMRIVHFVVQWSSGIHLSCTVNHLLPLNFAVQKWAVGEIIKFQSWRTAAEDRGWNCNAWIDIACILVLNTVYSTRHIITWRGARELQQAPSLTVLRVASCRPGLVQVEVEQGCFGKQQCCSLWHLRAKVPRTGAKTIEESLVWFPRKLIPREGQGWKDQEQGCALTYKQRRYWGRVQAFNQ